MSPNDSSLVLAPITPSLANAISTDSFLFAKVEIITSRRGVLGNHHGPELRLEEIWPYGTPLALPSPRTPFVANLPDACPSRIVKFLFWCDVVTAIMVVKEALDDKKRGSLGRQIG